MIETVECYANYDGEVIGNKFKSEKFIKKPYRWRKHTFNLLKRPKECQFIRAYS